jgi:ankyrin repeat protein
VRTFGSMLLILVLSLLLKPHLEAFGASAQSKKPHTLTPTRQATLDKALYEAVDQGYHAKVRSLLDRGASPNVSRPSVPGLKGSRSHLPRPGEYTGEDIGEPTFVKTQMPALIRAIWNGDRPIVQLLVERGANVNARTTDGKTALMWAIEFGDDKVIDLLLRRRADVNARSNDGFTALGLASDENNLALIRRLKQAGAKQ